MTKTIFIRLFICFFFSLTDNYLLAGDTTTLATGGLRFSSKNVYSSERTSLKLFNDYRHVQRSFVLSFSCSIYDPTLYGFVLRIINNDNKIKAPLLHLLYIPPQGSSNRYIFEFHFSNQEKIIAFEADSLEIDNMFFEIGADLRNNLITIRCNDSVKNIRFNFPQNLNLNFLFGLYGENIDVAPMDLRNVRLTLNEQIRYFWPLNEFSGNKSRELFSGLESEVRNPVWLQDRHYYWEKIHSERTDPMTGIAMDKENNILFINKDSLVTYNPSNNSVSVEYYNNKRPFERNDFFTIMHPLSGEIYGYDFHFNQRNSGQITYSLFNKNDNTWSRVDSTDFVDENHHHVAFWNEDATKLITFGGYSYFKYYNVFRSFDFNTKQWQILNFKGDTIFPRTHTSVGKNPYTNQYYLYGGFGNKEGSQSLEGRYFYDLYSIDPAHLNITKVWEINNPDYEFVPRGNLIFRPDRQVCYVLGSKPVEKTFLKLYEINLQQPEIRAISDSIPVVFGDMSGNAFLFLNPARSILFCITRETTNRPYAAVTVYRLKFPPVAKPESLLEAKMQVWIKYLFLIIPLVIVAGILWYYASFYRKKILNKQEGIKADKAPEKFMAGNERFERPKKNAFWFLNEFKVFDKNGHEITYRFAKKVKHAFIILFFENYFHNGITSAEFSDLLWPVLSKEQQKNNRGVIMNNIRKILEDIEGFELIKDDQLWRLNMRKEAYVDFKEIYEMISRGSNEENFDLMLDYFAFGNLLLIDSWEYIDQFREKYGSAVIEILATACRNTFESQNYFKCIEIAETILRCFDFLNENALIYKIKSLHILKNTSKALAEYNKYKVKYAASISKSFSLSFEDILKMPAPKEEF